MKLLLDTHVVLWALLDSARCPIKVAHAIADADNDVFVSSVSALEVAIKQSLGKLTLPGPAKSWLPGAVAALGAEWLELSHPVALAVGELPWHHRDPFDRLLVAQAQCGYTLVSGDARVHQYGVPVLWP